MASLLIAWAVGAVLVVAAFMMPGFHATSAPPPARSFLVILLFMAGWYAVLGAAVGVWLRPRVRPRWRRFAPAAALILALIGVAPVLVQNLRLLPLYQTYAAEWDAGAETLRAAAPGSDVVVPAFTVDVPANLGLESLTPDAGMPLNRCVAAFYGVGSVVARP
ncbi:MAG: hypothetical protein IPK19_21780 [Chloroflexi bacterium]|nr:hypothetical protein [Chloroflexota bacterium]